MSKLQERYPLSFADEHQTSLTLASQGKLCRMFISEAQAAPETDSGDLEELRQRLFVHYYRQLAAFMESYPRVQIEAVLLKPDLYASLPN